MTRIISQIFYGTLIHSLSLTKLSIIPNTLLGIDKFGKIAFVEENIINEQNINDILSKWNVNEEKIIRLTKRQFLIPGFVDTHIHAPQFPNAGTGLDLPLLEWLNKYTFPLEKSYSSLEFAKNVYPVVINNLLRNGTTTAVYFSTIHLESSKYLAKLIHEKGQRGFLGKVNMDRYCPNDYIETIESITPVITPRFAISCTSELLFSLSKLAQEYDLPIQSHLSENKDEIKFVKSLFPNLKDYTSVYEHHNLLNQKTIMAHGIYLSSYERNLIKKLKVGISHCPNSNFSLSSGICNVRKLLNDNIKVGLGTDISGGFGKSILDSIRNASIAKLFYLSTMGGANLVNLENVIGDERNILRVYVQGNFVSGTEFK
ncbi:4577_t:CDS:2 [Diversispora eburnea]|uniref:4577_t:CDS:1 n=1 Tax=Diversispora eburnea TaxID=1213867 RepID=A0A9N9F290_9GLOM|nr:4577_t:CDS:2 [Diversispora eburnea]